MTTFKDLQHEVTKLNNLLNDSHPTLKSWVWLVEQQSIIVCDMMQDLGLLDGAE
jgi:hypothetical protein